MAYKGKGSCGGKKGGTSKNVSLKIGKHKSRSGGLTKAGREKYNRETGSNLKALVVVHVSVLSVHA